MGNIIRNLRGSYSTERQKNLTSLLIRKKPEISKEIERLQSILDHSYQEPIDMTDKSKPCPLLNDMETLNLTREIKFFEVLLNYVNKSCEQETFENSQKLKLLIKIDQKLNKNNRIFILNNSKKSLKDDVDFILTFRKEIKNQKFINHSKKFQGKHSFLNVYNRTKIEKNDKTQDYFDQFIRN